MEKYGVDCDVFTDDDRRFFEEMRNSSEFSGPDGLEKFEEFIDFGARDRIKRIERGDNKAPPKRIVGRIVRELVERDKLRELLSEPPSLCSSDLIDHDDEKELAEERDAVQHLLP